MISRVILEDLKTGLDAVDAYASFYSPLNIAGRMALGKWEISEYQGFMGFVSDGTVRIIPQPDKAAYYQAILAWSEKHTVAFIPEYMATALRERGFKVLKQQTEYIMDPEKLNTLAGGALRKMRYDANRALHVAMVYQAEVPKIADELLALTKIWYAEAKDRLWRPSEKAHIEYLIQNWQDVLKLEPTARCIVARNSETDELLSFEMGSMLTSTVSSSFTQRSNRAKLNGVFSGVNLNVSMQLAWILGKPLNDGPADHKELAARKLKLCSKTVDFYTASIR